MTAAHPATHLHSRQRAHGRSLLELMVALIIGMIILGAVLLTSISGNSSGRRQDGVAVLNEDAQIAANLLGGHLKIAGYSRVVASPAPPAEFRNYAGPGVRGCDGGVANDNVNMNGMVCNGGNGPDALMVAYEGDAFNTFPTAGAPTIPTDCLGQALAPGGSLPTTPSEGKVGANYWLVENIFYVNNSNELVCSGNGIPGREQPLIGNVEDMQVTYGVADVPTAAAVTNGDAQESPFFEAARYMTAQQIDQLAPFPATALPALRGRWNRVVSVRVCLVLRSAEELYDQITPYPGCDGVDINPPDRRAYRAVTITRAIKNKTAPCADAAAAPGVVGSAPDRCAF